MFSSSHTVFWPLATPPIPSIPHSVPLNPLSHWFEMELVISCNACTVTLSYLYAFNDTEGCGVAGCGVVLIGVVWVLRAHKPETVDATSASQVAACVEFTYGKGGLAQLG